MALSANALCALSDVKTALGLTAATYDTALEGLIEEVSDAVESYCGQKLRYQGTPITEYIDVSESRQDIWVANKPIVAVTSVHENASLPRAYGATELLTVDEDYFLYIAEARIRRINQSWLAGEKSVKVIYTHGYAAVTDVPTRLTRAAVKLVAYDWNKTNPGDNLQGISSKSKGDGNVNLETNWPQDIVDVLQSFRRASMFLV